MIQDYVPDSELTFVRNPNYWDVDPFHPENKLPYVDVAKEVYIGDLATRMAALRTGKLDLQSMIVPDDAKLLKKTSPELKYRRLLRGNAYVIHMRSDTKPFDDIRVRKALAMAIDRQAIVNDFYGGDAEMLSTPAGTFGEYSDMYVPFGELPESTREIFEYHPDKAKQLLAEAGYPKGFETEVICQNLQASIEELSIVQGYWMQNLNVNAKIEVKEETAYRTIATKKTHTQMYYRVMNSGSPFKFNHVRPGQMQNLGMIDDKRENEAFADITLHWNDEAYTHAKYRELLPYEHAQCWYIQFPAPYTHTFWQPWVKGYSGEYCLAFKWNDYFAAYVWIDQDMKEEMTGRR